MRLPLNTKAKHAITHIGIQLRMKLSFRRSSMLIKIQTYLLNLYTFKDFPFFILRFRCIKKLDHKHNQFFVICIKKTSFVLGVRRRQCLFFDPVCVQSSAVNPAVNSIWYSDSKCKFAQYKSIFLVYMTHTIYKGKDRVRPVHLQNISRQIIRF